jgi:hypothetical protein
MCKSLHDVCACVGGSVRQTRGVGVEEKVESTWIQLFITIRNEVSIFVCVSNKRESVCVFIFTVVYCHGVESMIFRGRWFAEVHIYMQNSSKETTCGPCYCFHVRTEYVNELTSPRSSLTQVHWLSQHPPASG